MPLRRTDGPMAHDCALIIPALDEEASIGRLLEQLPRGRFDPIIVVDNGSRDRTAEAARAAGALVVLEPRRGYGQACLTGLEHLPPECRAVAFMDADLSDDPQDLARLLETLGSGGYDLVIGSRSLGRAEDGALRPLQRFGNWLATRLIRTLWGVPFTDLGPMRVITRKALECLEMRDRDFGWTVEMQAKAAKRGLRVAEVPVHYRRRAAGQSKVSGTVRGSIHAGTKILWTLYRIWREPAPPKLARSPLQK
jgi:glycosyltransferase involved in cell wall biosynthesis